MTGHIVEECYKLHGYPPGHKLHGKTKHHAFPSANMTSLELEASSDDKLTFTKEQYHQLLSLLQPKEVSIASHSVNIVKADCTHPPTMNGIISCLTSFTPMHIPTHTPWIIDTGATDHMICSTTSFSSITSQVSFVVKLPNGHTAPVTHIGTVHINKTLTLNNVLCVPSFHFNLISVKQLTNSLSCCFIFLSPFCFIQDLLSWTTIGMGEIKNGLYHLLAEPVSPTALIDHFSTYLHKNIFVSATFKNVDLVSDLWHCRLGHTPLSRLHVISDSLIKNHVSDISNTNPCFVCPLAKHHKLPFSVSSHKSKAIFELIHCDIWGPNSVTAYDGTRYFLTIVDDYSRSTWIYLLKAKSNTRPCIEAFCNLVETQFHTKVQTLRSDNGLEFHMTDFFNKKGIIHHRTCVETPQQNGIAERKHQHLLNIARALKIQSNLPHLYWNDCILTAAYIINRIPTPLLSNKTPFEILFNKPPTYSHMKILGCLCFASSISQNRHKFDPRGRHCVFLGYPFGVKGYKLLDLNINSIFISRDVTFHEHVFPFHQHHSTPSYQLPPSATIPQNPFPFISPYPSPHSTS